MKKYSVIIASMFVCLGDLHAQIWHAKSNANVSITSVGTDRYRVTITPTAFGATVILDTDGTNDVIEEIRVNQYSGGTSAVLLSIRDRNSPFIKSSIAAIESIDVPNPSTTGLVITELRIDGSVGTPLATTFIDAASVESFEIGGNLYAEVAIKDEAGSGIAATSVQIGGAVVGGKIINNSDSITSVVVGGAVSVLNGKFPNFYAIDGVGTISVGGNYAGFFGFPNNVLPYGDVDSLFVGGDFFGANSSRLNSLGSFTVAGDVDMPDAIIVDNIVGGVKTKILIGGSLEPVPGDAFNRAFLLPSLGLAENSVINYSNVGGGFGAVVAVGPRGLIGDYTRLTADPDVGGGSVGLAPFTFHQREAAPPSNVARDCDPFQNEVVVKAQGETFKTVTLSHYGPIYADGTGPHFRVEFRSVFNTYWEDKTSLFMVKTAGGATATTGATAQREVVVRNAAGNTTGFLASGWWRIRPLAGKVKCGDLVVGNPDVDYRSTVMAYDLDDDQDPNAELHGWYAFEVQQQAPSSFMLLQDPAGPTTADLAEWVSTPYEVNADGETNTTDFADLAEAYQGGE